MAEDYIGHGPGTPPDHGSAQIKRQALLLRTAMPDFEVTLLDQVEEGDRVANRWRGAGPFTRELAMPVGTIPPSGKRIEFEEMRIDRYVAGRVAESWFIPDRLSFWQDLGLVSGPPAPKA